MHTPAARHSGEPAGATHDYEQREDPPHDSSTRPAGTPPHPPHPNDMEKRPIFRYSLHAYENGVFARGNFTCDCCGRQSEYAYNGAMYCIGQPPVVCPECIASGEAARRFDGDFVQSASQAVTDPAKRDELFHRTPGYPSWQGEYYPACCDDFCTFVGDVGTEELEEMGIADELFTDYAARGGDPSVRDRLIAVGPTAGYLFRCLHCGAYHLHVDRE